MANRLGGRKSPTSQVKALASYDLNRNKKMYTGKLHKGEKDEAGTGQHRMSTKEVWSHLKSEKKFDREQRDANERNNGKLNNWRYK